MAVAVARAGYEEWATARTPVLLRLAYLLTGDRAAADAVVRSVLRRVESRWRDITRTDDPDRCARRLVVAPRTGRGRSAADVPAGAGAEVAGEDACWHACLALPDRQRAAVVLHCYEGLDETEVADLQDCSPAATRAHLQRAWRALGARLGRGDGSPSDDDLRRMVREALTARAELAADRVAGAPVTETDRGPRHRRTWLASAAVLAVVAVVAGISHASQSPSGALRYTGVTIPAGWRYESYDGVQLRVPPTWGWGGAPIRGTFNDGRLGSCGTSHAFAQPGSTGGYVPATTPFVGRPAVLSDVCMSWGSDGVMPTADAVWLDSPLPIGQRQVGSRIAETRYAWDQHVTVFSADPVLRREVLGSVERVDVDANGCPTSAVQKPAAGPAGLVPSSLSVCVYSQDTGVSALLWSARRDQTAARAYVAAYAASAGRGPADAGCPPTPQGEWVALGMPDVNRGSERWDVVDLACSRAIGHGAMATLTVDDVRPWAGGGTTAYVDGPRQPDAQLAPYFRGRLG